MPDLEPYEPGKNFVQLDCSLIKSEGIYSIPVKINYPKKFQLLSKSFDTINLKIKIKRIDELDNDDENQVNEQEQIRETVSMSKNEFKRAIGRLYKEHLITLESDGIRLKK